jgi:hypothetical protein
MFKRLLAKTSTILLAGALALPLLGGSAALACEYDGGTWSGSDVMSGTCTFAPGTDKFTAHCTSTDSSYYENYDSGVLGGSGCVSGYNPPVSTDNNSDETVTLNLPGGKNGSVTFPPGACPQKCSISHNLPAGANSSVPDDALATLYVRVVDEGGTPGEGSYTVCFSNPKAEALVIYRYLGGVWVAMRSAASDPICTVASGDGAFYLGD